MCIEHMLFIAIIIAYQRLTFRAGFSKISGKILVYVMIGFIFPIFVFIPEVLSIGSEAFVQRKVGPALCSYKVAKPVMKQFVRNDLFISLIQMFICIMLQRTVMYH